MKLEISCMDEDSQNLMGSGVLDLIWSTMNIKRYMCCYFYNLTIMLWFLYLCLKFPSFD